MLHVDLVVLGDLGVEGVGLAVGGGVAAGKTDDALGNQLVVDEGDLELVDVGDEVGECLGEDGEAGGVLQLLLLEADEHVLAACPHEEVEVRALLVDEVDGFVEIGLDGLGLGVEEQDGAGALPDLEDAGEHGGVEVEGAVVAVLDEDLGAAGVDGEHAVLAGFEVDYGVDGEGVGLEAHDLVLL